MIKVPVRSGSPFGVESFVACLAQETINHTRGTTKIRVPKSINKKYSFLIATATPHAFVVYLPTKLAEFIPRVTNLNQFKSFQGKRNMESQGCLGGYKKGLGSTYEQPKSQESRLFLHYLRLCGVSNLLHLCLRNRISLSFILCDSYCASCAYFRIHHHRGDRRTTKPFFEMATPLICFHFAFTRTDSKRNTRTLRGDFYA